MLSHSVMSDSLRPHGLQPARLLCPWGFFRQEYWGRLPCPPPGDLPNPGVEPGSPALQVDSLPTEQSGKPPIQSEREHILKIEMVKLVLIQNQYYLFLIPPLFVLIQHHCKATATGTTVKDAIQML